MAIIVPPKPSDDFALESIVVASRPAILIRDGTFRTDQANEWQDSLTANQPALIKAISAVGRLETGDEALPYVGTAFVVSESLAVTANYVADLLEQRRQRHKAGPDGGQDQEGPWLNLRAEFGSDATERIAIRNIHFVHPYWGFAFLQLEQPVDADRALPIPTKMSDEELRGRQICVIGYPNADFRNDEHLMRKLLGGVYGVKRLMPGQIFGVDRWGTESAVVLTHDAMTMSGTSGAPLVDIESGHVLGVQVAGQYLKANYAVPAWELARDPQWRHISKRNPQDEAAHPVDLSQQAPSIGSGEKLQLIFSFDEIIDLHRKLVAAGISDNQKIAGLFGGLPNEYVGLLPSEGEPGDKLLARLHAVNNLGGMIGEHSVFYYLLNNGERMRGWDSIWSNTIKALLAKVIDREKKAREHDK